jgi:hypothetical protein
VAGSGSTDSAPAGTVGCVCLDMRRDRDLKFYETGTTSLTASSQIGYKEMSQSERESRPRGVVLYHASDLTVSLIARQRPKLLEATLESIAETSPSEVVLQVLLNPPQDDVSGVVRRFGMRWPGTLKTLSTSTPLDFVDAHNLALEQVETPLVNFMGDDDVNIGLRLSRQLVGHTRIVWVGAQGRSSRLADGRPWDPLPVMDAMRWWQAVN